jgi:hypothetical protein
MMQGKEAEEMLKAVDVRLSDRATGKHDKPNLRMASMYGALREACWIHLSTGEDLGQILRRL